MAEAIIEILESDLRFLDNGSFGSIFLVKSSNPPMVLKHIFTKHGNNEQILDEECKALKLLSHRHIVKYMGLGRIVQDDQNSDRMGILLEYCERGSLRNLLYNPAFIYTIHEVVIWIRQLINALSFLQEHHMVHRDIKPANILVKKDYELKLADFGTIKLNNKTCTAHTLAGTHRYMSPEQSKDNLSRQLSLRSDIYSLGLVMWEMIERRIVFKDCGEFYDYSSNWNVFELTDVERLECTHEIGEIVKACTQFDLNSRPYASEVLLLLRPIEERYEEYLYVPIDPINDLSQSKPIKPIGFDGTLDRVECRAYGDSLIRFDIDINQTEHEPSTSGDSGYRTFKSRERAAAHQYIRGAYYTNWSQYRKGRGKFVPGHYKPGLCTHLFYAFADFDEQFQIRATEPTDLKAWDNSPGQYELINDYKKEQPDLKTLLSIGGWTFSQTGLFERMSSSSTNRKVFIQSVISWVREHNFDGIDIAWEYPTLQSYLNYVTLLEELREAIEVEAKANPNAEALLLTAAVAAGPERMEAYDISAMANVLDFVNLMCYDFWTPGDPITGMNAPLSRREKLGDRCAQFNLSWAANEWHVRGFQKHRIIIGVPTYGHGWKLKDETNIEPGSTENSPADKRPFSQEAGTATYYEICDMLEDKATKYWHDEHQVPWMIYKGEWWSYDDPRSIKLKMDYIKEHGYGGAFAWCLDFDDFNGKTKTHFNKKFPLIGVIAKELGNVSI